MQQQKCGFLPNRLVAGLLKRAPAQILSMKKVNHYKSLELRELQNVRLQHILKPYGLDAGIDLKSLLRSSNSQISQDLWIAIASGMRRNGTFLEIGGADGYSISNTYMLERELDWTGVIVEPALVYRSELRTNRQCIIETRCCSSESGKIVEFIETSSPMLSTMSKYRYPDTHATERIKKIKMYSVETVSLNELFAKYFSTQEVDCLSMDTEGSEEEILRTFDFSKYRFRFASIENGFNKEKSERIQRLLTTHGYKRVLEEISEFDDFYARI